LGATTIGGFRFNAGASAYSFSVPVAGSVEFTGAGITNNSSNSPSFSLAPTSSLLFANNSSAGNATFTTALVGILPGNLTFQDTSTADAASINNNGNLSFIGNSTAAAASITNNGLLTFGGTSTAENATVHTTNGAGGAFSIVLANNPVTVGSIEGAGLYFLGGNQLGPDDGVMPTTCVAPDCNVRLPATVIVPGQTKDYSAHRGR
jgi:hypothetical protein